MDEKQVAKWNAAVDKFLGKSKTAGVIALVSVMVAVGAMIVGIALGMVDGGAGFNFGKCALIWVAGIVFGVFGVGFSKIIVTLCEIRDKKFYQ